jgi:hypothetical protein
MRGRHNGSRSSRLSTSTGSWPTISRVYQIPRPENIQFETHANFQLMGAGIRRHVCLVSGGKLAAAWWHAAYNGGLFGRRARWTLGTPGYKNMYPLRTDRYGRARALLESLRICMGRERNIQSTT